MFRTLGSQLAAMATTVTLVVTLFVCAALYVGIRHSLYREVDAFLAGEVMEFRAILSASGGDLDDVQRRIRAELGSRLRGDLTFRLLDASGHVVLTSDSERQLPDEWPVPSNLADEIVFRNEQGSKLAAHTRSASKSIPLSSGEMQIVQATYLLDQVNASLDRFLKTCAIAIAVACLFAVLGGRFIAARSLEPISSMVLAARNMGLETLGRRLRLRGTGDELDLLAVTFNDMFERLETQVMRLRQFTADAAHELRTPVTVLRGNAELALSKRSSTEELRSTIADNIEEFDRLSRIADDLLLLARVDAGQLVLRREPFSLNDAIVDVVDLYAPVAEERGLELCVGAIADVVIDGDDGRFRQMLGNLIDNAIKYNSAGGRIEISLTTKNATAQLLVRDSGIGIAPEALPKIFDRFFRSDPARTRGGSGLGLSICKAIIEAHAGNIEISSELGRGTKVCVSMPVQLGQPARSRFPRRTS